MEEFEEVSLESFEDIREKLKAHGPFSIDPPTPPPPPFNLNGPRMNQRKIRFAYLLIKTGGDVNKAATLAGYLTRHIGRGSVAPKLFWGNSVFRAYFGRLWNIFLTVENASRHLPAIGTAALIGAIEQAAPGAIVQVPRMKTDIASRDEVLTFITAAIRGGSPGLYATQTADGGIEWNMTKILAAPPGVIKSIERRIDGTYVPTFHNAKESLSEMMKYYSEKDSKSEGGDQRINIRNAVVQLIQGDPDKWQQMDELAKGAAEGLRLDAIDAEIVHEPKKLQQANTPDSSRGDTGVGRRADRDGAPGGMPDVEILDATDSEEVAVRSPDLYTPSEPYGVA